MSRFHRWRMRRLNAAYVRARGKMYAAKDTHFGRAIAVAEQETRAQEAGDAQPTRRQYAALRKAYGRMLAREVQHLRALNAKKLHAHGS